MQNPTSPSAAASSVYSSNKSFQKAALPSFDKLTYNHDTSSDGFRQWATKLDALIEGNFPEEELRTLASLLVDISHT